MMDPVFAVQNDENGWPKAKHKMAELFRAIVRDGSSY